MSFGTATGSPRWLFSVCVAAALVPTVAAFAGAVSFHGLGPDSSYAMGVSADGSVVVGRGNPGIGSQGYRWTADAGITPIGVAPGDVRSEANGASSDGAVIVGASSNSGFSRYTPFRWTKTGGIQPLGTITGGGSRNIAVDVSADGAVIAGNAGVLPWRWTAAGGMAGLDPLPGQIETVTSAISDDGSTIVGAGKTSHGGVAFRWTLAGGMQDLGDLPGASVSGSARAVNGDGSVVVGVGLSDNGIEAFRWTADGGMSGLGDLPGGSFNSVATAVSADGSIVYGAGSAGPGASSAFVWDAAHGMRDLATVLTNEYGMSLGGWRLYTVTGTSADGLTIVGQGFNAAGTSESFVVVLPEPGAAAVLLGGSLLLQRRRRRSSRTGPPG